MLSLAAQERTAATEQAEQIVLEAREVAERLRAEAEAEAEAARAEAVEWVKTQRARVEEATSTMARDAERDAEGIRAEAMRSAMAEAEQTARLYVGEAAARGARDAEDIRRLRARGAAPCRRPGGGPEEPRWPTSPGRWSSPPPRCATRLAAIDTLLEDTRREPVGAQHGAVGSGGGGEARHGGGRGARGRGDRGHRGDPADRRGRAGRADRADRWPPARLAVPHRGRSLTMRVLHVVEAVGGGTLSAVLSMVDATPEPGAPPGGLAAPRARRHRPRAGRLQRCARAALEPAPRRPRAAGHRRAPRRGRRARALLLRRDAGAIGRARHPRRLQSALLRLRAPRPLHDRPGRGTADRACPRPSYRRAGGVLPARGAPRRGPRPPLGRPGPQPRAAPADGDRPAGRAAAGRRGRPDRRPEGLALPAGGQGLLRAPLRRPGHLALARQR
ncbi:hypothetical protein [Nocardioides convexus]|uniref:hypothetical protein n=1 Tax=Nocardioides convexus TaxID=2712224 RepID=UPI002418917D|nr:hypothetical protein [Nocardioides convexus]